MSGIFDFQVGQLGARIVMAIKARDPISGLLSPLNLATASQFDITIKKPISGNKITYLSGSGEVIFTQPPDGAGDGSDGLIEALTLLDTDLDEKGQYLIQAEITDTGVDGFTQVGSFSVGANL
jgi:hypothetical protein